MLTKADGAWHRDGCVWLRAALAEPDLRAMGGVVSGSRPGQRFAAGSGLQAILGTGGQLHRALQSRFGPVRPVRAVGFNKSEASNWGVGWHQDRVIAVQDRHEVPGFGKWTLKSGLWHCEPPQHILDQMVFCRLFLDDVTAANGGMQFAPGSHLSGAVAEPEIPGVMEGLEIMTEDAERGDVLVLHMNMLHRSSPAPAASARRVLRVDYAACELPEPLRWAGV